MGHYIRMTQAGFPRHSDLPRQSAAAAGATAGESHEPETGKEAGKNETTPFGNRSDRMKNHECHFSRTDKH